MKVLVLLMVLFSGIGAHAQQKRLYIANDDHTDYMWTADEVTYDSAFVQMLDYYLLQIDSTKKNLPDFQARFNTDGSLWLKAYEKHRTPAQFARLLAAIQSGHISSPLNTLVSTYGAQPTEAVIRGMYYAGQLERKHKLRFSLVQSMENNTLPLGLSSLWAGSGAKYSWKGIGGYGSQMSYEMRTKRRHQMYRYNGLDHSGVLMKWYAYNEKTNAPLGGYAECRLKIKYQDLDKEIGTIVNMLDAFCDTAVASAHRYNVAGAFGFGHDDLSTFISQPFINAARNNTTPTRRVRVSNQEDFFKDFESTYPSVPAQSVSFGNEWDLLCASMNETTAKVRRATEKLRTAEALASVVSLRDKNFGNDLAAARNAAWESFGVYWEHNWTADGPVSRQTRAAWQMKRQQLLTNYVDTLYDRSLKALGTHLRKTTAEAFYVFNPLSWVRNDVADIPYSNNPVKVIDRSTGKEAISQPIQKDGRWFIRIWAENIPSVGYKIFDIAETAYRTKDDSIYANKYYRLTLSRSGAITALYDSLANGRSLVNTASGKFLNDLGASDVNDGDPVIVENSGPVSFTLKAVSNNPLPHTVRVTLFANGPRIEIEDSIQANFGDVKTWAFSYNLTDPTTRHEELGAILTVKKESTGGHYADENARYDWQTFNHFANMSENNYGVTLSNMDCSFFKLGNSTIDSLCEQSAQINALAGGNIDKKVEDGGVLGILNQNGQKDFGYKFALTTHQSGFDAVRSMKFSLEHQNPLVTGMITGVKGATAATFSLLSLNNPCVLLWTVKPSEEGVQAGVITRFWNVANKGTNTTVTFNRPITSAWQTTNLETNLQRLTPNKMSMQLPFKRQQMKTYRWMF